MSTKILKLQLNIRNHARLFAAVPDAVKQVIKDNKGVVLAGGAIRSGLEGNMPSDFDIFFQSFEGDSLAHYDDHDQLIGIASRMVDVSNRLQKRGFKLVFSCPQFKLMTLKAGGVKIQLINRSPWYKVPDLLKMFDFSVCCFATEDFTSVYCNKQSILDVKKRRLSIVCVKYPVATLNRLHKYRNYGYKINARSMQDLCWSIAEEMNNWVIPEGEDFFDRLNDQMSFYID